MKIIPNPKGIAALQRSVQMQAFLKSVADEAADHARDIAPVESGDYRDSIETDVQVAGPLAFARIFSTDWKAIWIEKGTSENPPYAPLRKGADAAGIKIVGD